MIMGPARARIEEAYRHPAEALSAQIGTPGYSLPALDGLEWRPVGDPADDNWLVAAPGRQGPDAVRVNFRGGHGNVAIYGAGSTIYGAVDTATSDATVIFGERTGIGSTGHVNVHGLGTGGCFFFGAASSANQAAFFLQGDQIRLVVGDDCMFAHAITVRTGDDHSMIDVQTGQFLNPPTSITIEPHVWVCPEVHVLKGSTIGFGSTIALKSIVQSAIPRFSLVGGQPARVLRQGVTWDRPDSPRPNWHHHMSNWASTIPLHPALANTSRAAAQ
jgi:acetyltransferase-like isoleucine patch superfamily enzyme